LLGDHLYLGKQTEGLLFPAYYLFHLTIKLVFKALRGLELIFGILFEVQKALQVDLAFLFTLLAVFDGGIRQALCLLHGVGLVVGEIHFIFLLGKQVELGLPLEPTVRSLHFGPLEVSITVVDAAFSLLLLFNQFVQNFFPLN